MVAEGGQGPRTAISSADAEHIAIRGQDLCRDLMGKTGFTEMFHLLVTGRKASADQLYFLDVLLVAIAEHGLMPSVIAARVTLAAAPEALQGAVAAGILGAGSVFLGAAEDCGRFLVAAGESDDLRGFVQAIRDRGDRVPGFGHPVHKRADPRTTRIFELWDQRGLTGQHVARARQCAGLVAEIWNKPLPMNVSMAIAAVLLDLGYPAGMLKAVPILARTAGLLAHLAEEQAHPIGLSMAAAAGGALGRAGT